MSFTENICIKSLTYKGIYIQPGRQNSSPPWTAIIEKGAYPDEKRFFFFLIATFLRGYLMYTFAMVFQVSAELSFLEFCIIWLKNK